MSGIQQLLLGGPFGAGAQGDPNWQNVTLLSGTTTTNGAQNNTFLDSSSNNFTITRNGNTTQGSFTPFSQAAGYWSNYFDGSSSYLSFSSNSALAFGTSDITIEFWVNYADSNGNYLFYDARGTNISQTGIAIYVAGGTLYVNSALTNIIGDGVAPSANTWHHIAYTRSGSSNKIFVDGVQTGSTGTNSTNFSTAYSTSIGSTLDSTYTASYSLKGYISNLRVLKGTAQYTANFTPPTTPLTAITNTQLLTCQSNRFVDNSSNAIALTATGSPSVVPFQPFGAPTSPYSTTNVGGSGYFDGTGDTISAASNTAFSFGTGDFTIEAWIYPTSLANAPGFTDTRAVSGDSGYAWYIQSSSLFLYTSGNDVLSGGIVLKTNTWTHIALVRNGSTISQYVNGVLDVSATYSGSMTCPGSFIIAGWYNASTPFTGYISNYRLVKGTAVYTAGFTPPTSPVTAITNTNLLCNFTNANIYDQAADNDFETAGNAQVSTSVKKYGDSSMSFDGTGDYLVAKAQPTYKLGTGDFTIECWAYWNTVGTQVIVGNITNGGGDDWAFYYIAGGTDELRFIANGAAVILGAKFVPSTSTWYHLAVSKTSGVYKFFVNGSQIGSTANTTSITFAGSNLYVGSSNGNTLNFNGYISDLRITTGLGRYTYTFTPPTTSLPNFYQAQTLTADPYFDYTTLLLPGTGTNGAQNNTFLDSSTNAFSITRNGNTTQGTFSPFSQTNGYWGNYFDGTGDYLSGTMSSDLAFGTSDMSMQCWVYPTTLGSNNTIFDTRQGGTNFGNDSFTLVVVSGIVSVAAGSYSTSVFVIESPSAISANTWTHIAFSRVSGTNYLFVNGVQVASNSNSWNQTYTAGRSFYIGQTIGFSREFAGYISNLKAVNGTGFTSITVPTTPLTATTNTKLLACQSNRFVDNSASAFALTANGNVSVQQFSPFNPTAAYSAATNGGSGYFDGVGDYLSIANNSAIDVGTGAFTWEVWWYPVADEAAFLIAANVSNGGGWLAMWPGPYISIGRNGIAEDLTTPTNAVKLYQWNHIVVARNSSNNIAIFINGSRQGYQSSNTNDYGLNGGALTIGYGGQNANYDAKGYITCSAVYKSAQYDPTQTTITVPTAPSTAGTAGFLCNFTNAGITDATAKNDLETLADAQISNTTAKWGNTSIKFDGTGDSLLLPSNPDLVMGSGDFTIEMWAYYAGASYSGVQYLVDQRNTEPQIAISLYFNDQAVEFYVNGSSRISANTTAAVQTWQHIALVRYGGTTKLYVNGSQIGSSYADSNTYVAPKTIIGDRYSGSYVLNGYIQDLRITKGIARYTQNFTPPTAAFQLL